MMKTQRLTAFIRYLPALLIAAVIAVTAAPAAYAASTDAQEATSENWSGYAVGGSSGTTQFSSVAGSWVQPSATCSSAQGYAAFWVGLGGAGQGSQALEQIGTQSDCVGGGQSQYYAWYELVPSAPVKLDLAIRPGDQISARVTVSGTDVTVALSDQTTGGSATKMLQMSNPDTSSAEWIAEAPSTCDQSGDCQPLPLSDFGTVKFTGASATANGHTGSISDSSWGAEAVQLSGGADQTGFAQVDPTAQADPASAQSGAGAQPSALSPDGTSFSVSWLQSGTQASDAGGSGTASGSGTGTGAGTGGYPGDGGYGGGYGGGYPGDSGYGYGYPGYAYPGAGIGYGYSYGY